MIYQIDKKYDLEKGQILKIRFPAEDLDEKALYTVQNDFPDFLVPFKYRTVNGEVECTYQIGSLMKLQYRFGRRTKEAYIDCWKKILRPFVECKDYFMNPYSFVMEVSELYTEKDERHVKYLYVPSKNTVSDYEALKKMAEMISDQLSVNDLQLENDVLKAMRHDFTPRSFLQVLSAKAKTDDNREISQKNPSKNQFKQENQEVFSKETSGGDAAAVSSEPVQEPEKKLSGNMLEVFKKKEKESEQPKQSENKNLPGGDINLDWDLAEAVDGKEKKDKKNRFGLNKDGKTKKEPKKELKSEKKKKGGLFEKKKKEVVTEDYASSSRMLGVLEKEEHDMDLEDERRKLGQKRPNALDFEEADTYAQDDAITVIQTPQGDGPCLTYVGNHPGFPARIDVIMSKYQRFTIGRFDVTVGKKQSDFEFDKSTRGVSRFHAVIEFQDGQYMVTDLQSSAGTYVNGERLRMNETVLLRDGVRISFGTDGADYCWKS